MGTQRGQGGRSSGKVPQKTARVRPLPRSLASPRTKVLSPDPFGLGLGYPVSPKTGNTRNLYRLPALALVVIAEAAPECADEQNQSDEEHLDAGGSGERVLRVPL